MTYTPFVALRVSFLDHYRAQGETSFSTRPSGTCLPPLHALRVSTEPPRRSSDQVMISQRWKINIPHRAHCFLGVSPQPSAGSQLLSQLLPCDAKTFRLLTTERARVVREESGFRVAGTQDFTLHSVVCWWCSLPRSAVACA